MWAVRGTVIAALLLANLPAAFAQEPSLPEIARQRNAAKAVREYTDEDFPSAPAPLPPVESKPAGKPTADAKVTVPTLLDGASLEQAQALLQSLKNDEQVLLRRYAQIEEKLAVEKDESLRKLYSDSLGRRGETLARKRRAIAAVREAISKAEMKAGTNGHAPR
jgi:hypothetical protein